MSAPEAAESANPAGSRPSEPALPSVEAPTGTFILQLFLIPLLIVSIVVVVWMGFSWLAHMGRDDPQALVASLERGDDSSWQRAYELADLLRSPDPRYDALRRDSKLARSLANLLKRDLAEPARGEGERARVMRRMYLCRALGSFQVLDGLPVLIEAARTERDPVEVEVRYSAVEAIATLADNCGPRLIEDDKQAMAALFAASREQDDGSAPAPAQNDDGTPTLYRPHAELRAVAAYTLGVVGGDDAVQRLRTMLHDGYPNARYNAATGLARHGDPACESVLREMLDPTNDKATADESHAGDQERKRTTVLLNGIRATMRYFEANPTADQTKLKASLDALAHSPLEQVKIDRSKIQAAALEALRMLEAT
jgi:HEAT repeat protein